MLQWCVFRGPRSNRIFDTLFLDWRTMDLRLVAPKRTFAPWVLKWGTHRLRTFSLFFPFLTPLQPAKNIFSFLPFPFHLDTPKLIKGKLGADGRRPEIPLGVSNLYFDHIWPGSWGYLITQISDIMWLVSLIFYRNHFFLTFASQWIIFKVFELCGDCICFLLCCGAMLEFVLRVLHAFLRD